MTESNSSLPNGAAVFNEFQAQRLYVTCQYMDRLLGEIESVLGASASKAAFPRYFVDVGPDQCRKIENQIAELRAFLVRVLDDQGISREGPSIPASRAIRVALGTIDIAAEELKPQHMRGYGDLAESAATELNEIAAELRDLVSKLDRCLIEEAGHRQELK
jgi:hypothetical protein